MEIEDTLEAEQAFVDGLIDVYSLTDNLDLVCNDEGLINGLEPKVVILGENVDGKEDIREFREIIHGNCFICRHDDEGNFLSIREEDVETIKNLVKAVVFVYGGVIMIEK